MSGEEIFFINMLIYASSKISISWTHCVRAHIYRTAFHYELEKALEGWKDIFLINLFNNIQSHKEQQRCGVRH